MFLERSYNHPKLADAEKVSEKVASDWLQKQALLLVYLSAPLHIMNAVSKPMKKLG